MHVVHAGRKPVTIGLISRCELPFGRTRYGVHDAEARRRRATCAGDMVQMHDEKPLRRVAGQREAEVSLCRSLQGWTQRRQELAKESGTGVTREQGRTCKHVASPRATACKCPRGHGESKNPLGPVVPGSPGSEPIPSL